MKQVKTNAMRILDAKKLPYDVLTYDNKDGKIDGVSVAGKIKKDPQSVFKTLVAEGSTKGIYIYVIPVEEELDLKKAAKVAGEKKVELIPVKDIQKWTGYIKGGCSPIGMKKQYPTFLEESAKHLSTIVVSGGKIGVQVELSINELQKVIRINVADLIK